MADSYSHIEGDRAAACAKRPKAGDRDLQILISASSMAASTTAESVAHGPIASM
jgi:hypothetical protein